MKTLPGFHKLIALTAVILLSAGISSAAAQEKEQPKPAAASTADRPAEHPTTRETTRDSYKLEFTFLELEGSKKINSRTYTVMCEDLGGRTAGYLRIGSRVPVPIYSAAPGGATPAQFQYMDVGMKIDARLVSTADGALTLSSTVG